MSRAADLASSGGGGGGDADGGGEGDGDGDGGGGDGDGGEGDANGGGLAATEGALEQATAVESSWLHRCEFSWLTHARTLPVNSPSDAKWA